MTKSVDETSFNQRIVSAFANAYDSAEALVKSGEHTAFLNSLPITLGNDLKSLGERRHNGRGVVLTLAACKIARPSQDIRSHKAEHIGGFNARSIDTDVVIPMLRAWNLHNAGESHWLTQVFSGQAFAANQILKTQPKIIGQVVPRLVCEINAESPDKVGDALCAILIYLILERNKSRVPLTKPKRLTIQQAIKLLSAHFQGDFKTGGPRLPQIAVYAVYECLLNESKRYKDHELVPLERLKTANRKSGTVGDVDVNLKGRTVEAVEIKFGMQVETRHVSDAIEKIKTADVRRYYILATGGVKSEEADAIDNLISSFHRSNGCEIIVNGIFGSLRYYLRLVESVDEFISRYADRLATDEDLGYEHRIAWNTACEQCN